MAEDPQTKAHMDIIKHHPKFDPKGELDDDFFYTQSDGSFFDPEGYYFNPAGYDDIGGYYDDNGEYHDPEMEEAVNDYYEEENDDIIDDPVAIMIEVAEPNTQFHASLSNLPYFAPEQDIEAELKSAKVNFTKFDITRDNQKRIKSVEVVMNSKEAAFALNRLNGQRFLGRLLRVEFLNLSQEIPPLTPIAPPVVTQKPPEAKIAKKPKPEKKEDDQIPPIKPPKEEEVKRAPVNSVWELSTEELLKEITPTGIIKHDTKPKTKTTTTKPKAAKNPPAANGKKKTKK